MLAGPVLPLFSALQLEGACEQQRLLERQTPDHGASHRGAAFRTESEIGYRAIYIPIITIFKFATLTVYGQPCQPVLEPVPTSSSRVWYGCRTCLHACADTTFVSLHACGHPSCPAGLISCTPKGRTKSPTCCMHDTNVNER